MRVLVSGATGSLGRIVTAGLAELAHDIVGLDLVPAPEGTTYANTRGWWDLGPGRRLGYEPKDDAEAEFVGGPFTLAQFDRPALG